MEPSPSTSETTPATPVDLGATPRGAVSRATMTIGILAAVASAFLARWTLLASSPDAFDVDGYYYAVQVRSLLAGQGLYYPAPPLAFWWLALSANLLGVIPGIKLGAAIGTSLAAVPAALLVARVSASRAAAVLAAVLVASSAQGVLLTTGFVKQGLGVTLALAFVAVVVAAADAPSTGRRILLAVGAAAGLVACVLTHEAAFGLALFFVAPLVIVSFFARVNDRTKRSRTLVITAVGAALLGVIVLVPWRLSPMRPGPLLSSSRMELFRGLFHAPRVDGAGSFWQLEATLAGACSLALVAWWWRKRRAAPETVPINHQRASIAVRVALVGPAAFGLLVALPWLDTANGHGLGGRLALMGFASLALVLPVLLVRALDRMTARRRDTLLLVVAIALLAIGPRAATAWVASDATRWPRSRHVAMLRGLRRQLPADTLVIAHERRTAFLVTWLTGLEAQATPPRGAEADHAWRLLLGEEMTREDREALRAFETALPSTLPRPIRGVGVSRFVIVVPEQTWQAFRSSRASPAGS